MGIELSLFSGIGNALIQKQAINEVMKYNDLTAQYGLALTEKQAFALVETRSTALLENGRIEFGGGVIDKIILAFCDSPYISMQSYEETLHELIEIFYYYKNETLDMMVDDDLIEYMKNGFNGICKGSLDLLSNQELDRLARNLRFGYPLDYSEDPVKPVGEGDDDEH